MAEATVCGNCLEREIRAREQDFRSCQPLAENLVGERPTEFPLGCAVQFGAWNAQFMGNLLDSGCTGDVALDDGKGAAEQGVVGRFGARRLTDGDATRRNEERVGNLSARPFRRHQFLKKCCAFIANALQVVADGRKGCRLVEADELVVVHAKDGDLLGHGNPCVAAGVQDAGGIVVRIGEDGNGFRQFGDSVGEFGAVESDEPFGGGEAVLRETHQSKALQVSPF